MYTPGHFKQDSIEELKKIIVDYPFATLVTQFEDNIEANHIPMHLEQNAADGLVLKGHVAQANPVWKDCPQESKSLAIFNGPNVYISPGYYPSKMNDPRVVPTWNYIVVHVRGPIAFVHDADWKLDMLNTLTNQHEKGQTKPWRVADAPEEYTQKLLAAIIGIEIKVETIEGKWKLSQNQPETNKQGVIQALSGSTTERIDDITQYIRDTFQN